MKQEYIRFLTSDSMILTYEIVVLVVLLILCIVMSKRQKKKRAELELEKEEMKWQQLQESLKNNRK